MVFLDMVGLVFLPQSLYLETEKHQLQFNRGENVEVFGVQVNNPPAECRTFRDERPWSLAAGNLALAAVILVFLRRAPTGTPGPGPQEGSQSGTPGSGCAENRSAATIE